MAEKPDGLYVVFDKSGQPWGLVDMSAEATTQFSTAPSEADVEYSNYLIHECNLAASTVLTYTSFEARVLDHLGKTIHELTVDDVRRVLRHPEHSPNTKAVFLAAIKSRLRWMLIDKRVKPSPDIQAILELRAPRRIVNPKEVLSPEEVRVYLEACQRPNEFRLVYLGVFAGTRISESARIGEEEWRSDRLRFLGKGRKIREVPLHPELMKVRDLILEKSPSPSTLKHTMTALAHWTNIPATSHTFRHTFSRTLRKKKVPREVIGALLGHAPQTTTEVYAPVEYEELVEAIEKLEYPRPTGPRQIARTRSGLEVVTFVGESNDAAGD